jgi:hypothetical protein
MKRILFVGLALVLALATVALYHVRRGGDHAAFAFHWPKGQRYVYTLVWTGTQTARLLAGREQADQKNVSGAVDIAADLELVSYGEQDGATLLGARVARVQRHRFEVLGQDVLADPARAAAAFDGREAFVEIEPSGRVRAIRFRNGDESTFKHLMQWLLTQMQVVLPSERGWTDEAEWLAGEPGPFGTSTAKYEKASPEPRLVRTRVGYDRLDAVPAAMWTGRPLVLDGKSEVELEPAGQLRALANRESLRLTAASGELLFDGAMSLELVLRESGPVELAVAPDLTALERRVPGEVVASPALQRKLLENQAAGMTADMLLDDLARYGGTATTPDLHRWMWRATGLLRLHPEACAMLAEPFENLGTSGRYMIFDLLASAGTPEAQKVMRDLLGTPAGRSDAIAHGMMLQRLGLVDEATRETAEYVAQAHRAAAGDDDRHATAFAMGAVVGKLGPGANDVAMRLNGELRDELARARHPRDREMLLRALGNAGREDNAPTLVEYTRSDDPRLRHAAATALRTSTSASSNDVLIGLVEDVEPAVQSAALGSLVGHPLAGPQVAALDTAARSGKLDAVNAAQLVTVLAGHIAAEPSVRETLQFLLARSDTDAMLRARIRQLLSTPG